MKDGGRPTLPVPADVLVYTDAEWQALMARGGRFARVLRGEAVWVWPEAGGCPSR